MPVLTDRTQGAWLTRGHLTVHRHFLDQGTRGVPQEGAALRQLLLPHPVGQEAEVPQPLEAGNAVHYIRGFMQLARLCRVDHRQSRW